MRNLAYHICIWVTAGLFAVQAAAQNRQDAYMGVPYFKNYPAGEYNAHNRNFDVLCDDAGHVFFANFEGLLVYDMVEWRIVHTPDISRVVSLHKDEQGAVLFEGVNLTGRVQAFEGDSVRVSYTQGGNASLRALAGNSRAEEGAAVDRWEDIEVYQRLRLSANRTLLATATDGVVAIDEAGRELWRVNVNNGLCSNSITKLAYDGKGTVWGATDNGVFSISVSDEIYTRFTEKEGLRGQISSIAKSGLSLMVGTFQGLYRLEGQHFVLVPNVRQACWQMAEGPGETLYVATSDGVYEYSRGVARQLTSQFALSIQALEDGSYLVGELERLVRLRPGEGAREMEAIPTIVRFKNDSHGGLWAPSLTGETYHMAAGSGSFRKEDGSPMSRLFEYEDQAGHLWHSFDSGTGLYYEDMPQELESWFRPFAGFSVQAMLVDDGLVWIGGNDQLVRFNLEKCRETERGLPRLYVHRFLTTDSDLSVSFSNDGTDPIGETLYSYRLRDADAWSKWSPQQEYLFAKLGYGTYHFSVRSQDPYGKVTEAGPYVFRRPYPFYVRWYSLLVYLLLVVLLVNLVFRYRMRRMAQEQARLEAIVEDRTRELRSAQDKLLRQEREAAIGKLTKGLIDRILNPMNYINNFAHLTLGLNKELRENVEDEKDKMDPDTYEDSVDVMDMMKTNLEKIEQHGISTTRTLKAMEEMLKERSTRFESADVVQLCQQCMDIFGKYYASDIASLGISVDFRKPDTALMRDVVAEQINKSVMSMLANSIYAIKKKAGKGGEYKPELRLSVLKDPATGHVLIKIYDNGIGIEKSIMDKIFDPFFTTKPTADAPGVGLYMSQQALRDCGGTITVDSVKDEYTEFVINLA